MDLRNQRCEACESGIGKLSEQEIQLYASELSGIWEFKSGKLCREYRFSNFIEAFSFVSKVALVAESEGHHPDITFGWGYVRIELFTHSVGGLTKNDFILAAKLDSQKS